ncbi:hypothetical protein ACLMJK_006805 [Lecanora helva]
MEMQGSATRNHHAQDLRDDPSYPPPSSFPPPRDSELPPLTNGLARTTSRRRRASGSGPAMRVPAENVPKPPAPEPPRAPPVSYRPPNETENHPPPKGNYPSPSFAERARALTGNATPTEPSVPDTEATSRPAKPIRRGSLNRPIGGVYSEIQQHKRDSFPPRNGPTSPRRFSNPTSPQQQQPLPPSSPPQGPDSTTLAKNRSSETGSRRASAGFVQSGQKEWASDRSPLQKLEVKLSDISKEEKRARVQEAEQRLRDSQAGDNQRGSVQQQSIAGDRTSSRRIPTTTERRLPGADPGASSQYPTQSVQPKAMEAEFKSDNRDDLRTPNSRDTQVPRSDKRQESFPINQQAQAADGENVSDADHLYNNSRKQSTKQKRISGNAQQPERGVRFQGQDGVDDVDMFSPDAGLPEHNNRKRSPRAEALARSDEARSAQRDQHRQGSQRRDKRSSVREVPAQQNDLYSSKAQDDQDDASAAMYGRAADPVPRSAVQGHGQAANYEIPPQTAAGIHARQAVGFGHEPQATPEISSQRKHHLSNILHRSHHHTLENYDHNDNKPMHLDEWRRAGTARLTAADFGPDVEQEQEHTPWWERSGPGSRRKQGRAGTREVKSPQGGYSGTTGKSRLLFNDRSGPDKKNEMHESKSASIQTRQYLGEDELARLRDEPYHSHESHLSHFLRRSGHDQGRRLSSAYSYSCPDLAVHDPSHPDHICEPYLSKELTQSMRSIRIRAAPELATFDPPLYLKCGPLLRYTGLKRDRLQMKARSGGPASVERETWRGSVMIVTADADSSYDPVPILHLFPEPMDILPPPPHRADAEDNQDLPSEYVDPVAGLPKLSRSGKTVYVKPVDDLEHGKDLSRLENDDGLFEETRTAAVPTAYGTPDFRASSSNPKPVRREGRPARKGQRVKGVRLHVERGVTFWRFNLEVELGAEQARIAYSINNSPSIGFWVPAQGHSFNMMFHSCNGFSMSVNPDNFAGPDPLWRDVLNTHQTRPFHVMIGGGDQIYNDAVMIQCPRFKEWLELKNPQHKHDSEFSPEMQEELETFYLERYSMWFSQGLFGMANSQIPMVNMWDDHDIIDGFGSYPHHFMSTPVFCGIGAVAFKYYMLFQHQSVPDEGSAEEPSWILGASPGPYISDLSRSVFVSLGKNIALLAVDCRTERMREEVLSEASYHLIFDRCRREILEGETKHLIVLLGIPIAYPRLVWLENLLTSKVMDPVKYLGKAGMLGSFLNKFDGGVEILDDLDDHWTAKNHKLERNWFIQELQEFAAEKSVRVTILGGDVHLAAVGQFYSSPKLRIPKDKDHRYMVNVVSSAIVNTPPPNNMADILNRRNKTHHLDPETDEDMIPMFNHDVNGTSRNNKRLLPRRNWCSIREYHPGSTPPPTPPSSEPESEIEESPPPRTPLQRTLSLTRNDVKPGNLLRRLSGRGPPPSDDYLASRRNGFNAPSSPDSPDSPDNDGYFPRQATLPKRANTTNAVNGERHSSAPLPNSSAPLPRPGNFHRRPTNMSEIAAAKGDTDEMGGHINLEHGLDIVLNCEVNQKDPAGTTVPYRLLVPALFYEGYGDENDAPLRKKSLVSRLTSIRGRRRNTLASNQGRGKYGQAESITPSESEGEDDAAQPQPRPRRWSFGIMQRRQYRDQTPPSERHNGEEREIGEEGTQKGRQLEHRKQQIGPPQQLEQQPFVMPPRQQQQQQQRRQYPAAEPVGPQTPTSDHYSAERGDSVDYHQHLDHSPPAAEKPPPARRLSKVDRMLGVANLQRNPSATGGISKVQRSNSAGNGYAAGGKQHPAQGPGPRRYSFASDDGYSDEDYDDDEYGDEGDDDDWQPTGSQRVSRGYSGIEAYSEKKGWRKWLDKAKEWEERSSGRRG